MGRTCWTSCGGPADWSPTSTTRRWSPNIQRLARTEGIFAETAGGVTVGVTAKLIADGVLDPDAETVVINSGDGLKTLDSVADKVGPKITIAPRYEAFTDFWKEYRG